MYCVHASNHGNVTQQTYSDVCIGSDNIVYVTVAFYHLLTILSLMAMAMMITKQHF
jgi:hypothetical protein